MNKKYVRIVAAVLSAISVVIVLLVVGGRMGSLETPSAGFEVLAPSVAVKKPSLAEIPEQEPELQPLPATAPTATSPRQPQRVPLPSASLPLSDVFDELKERADAGDVRAACRLGNKLDQCADLSLHRLSATRDEQVPGIVGDGRLSPQAQEDALEDYLDARDRAKAIVAGCSSIDRFQTSQAAHYTLQAAQAGRVSSMLEFLDGLMTPRSSDFLANPDLGPLYQHNAMPMLLRALQTGEPNAVIYLQRLLRQPDLAFLVEQLPPTLQSPETANALLDLLRARANPILRGIRDPNLTSTAFEAAQTFYDQYFSNSPRWEESELLAIANGSKIYSWSDQLGLKDDGCDEDW